MTRRSIALSSTFAAALAIVALDVRAQATTGAAPSPVFGLMQGLVGLVIVIGLIFAAGWLMRKFGPRTSAAGLVRVVGGTSVGPREKVVVVRFAGQTLLLGVAPGQVSLLAAADTVDGVDETAAAPGTPTFVERLRVARSGA